MKFIGFVRKNTVFVLSLLVAAVTSFIVPPDREYIDYFDFKTLSCLFLVLAVICAFREIRFFYIAADKIIILSKDRRICVLALTYITFLSSLIIGNDMALLTFLPLAYQVLHKTENDGYIAFTFVLMGLSANLGGMVTPFGNPQNLYLYTHFNIGFLEFIKIMILPFLASMAMITLCCFYVKKSRLQLTGQGIALDLKRTLIFSGLFIYVVLIIIRLIPYWTGLILIPAVLLAVEKEALKKVDYPLLGTFICFFCFAGNMSRMPAVSDLVSGVLAKNTMLVSALCSQVISNVPAAVLLSQFTDNYSGLLLGVNIGGAGTLIASLASLITLNEYMKRCPGKAAHFIGIFTLLNVSFLVILLAGMKLIGYS